MMEIARENFRIWNDALQSLDPSKVAALYASDNTFLPTLSPEFKQGTQGAADYFHHFLEKHPFGKIVADQVQQLSESAYIYSGLYNFEVGPADNRSTAEARFTFVYTKDNDGQWKIAHHHSSLKPQA